MALVIAASGPVLAQNAGKRNSPDSASFEIVRSHTDIDVAADGSYVQAEETAVRVLDSRSQKAFQQTTLAYTEGLQSLAVEDAYTLKANGEKIPVPQDQIMKGAGATSAPGFEDDKTLTIVFPRLDIGDEVVLTTLRKQIVPLFTGAFATRLDFSRAVKTDDTEITLTSPKSGYPLKIDAVGFDSDHVADYAGKTRRVWHYHNDNVATFPLDSVLASDDQPHLTVSSFPGYDAVGKAYGAHFAGKADVTPAIQSLADQITKGISERRAQAKALYDWVSANISYVNIVLGAGGFTPHSAAQVLSLHYGDCKDHVMLLQALLTAKGISSNAALIAAGGPFVLSAVPSPFYFNHLITYVPEFRLYLDSTAHYAPFGVLPLTDIDRPVLLVPDGTVSATPNNSADQSTGKTTLKVKFDPDGTANGEMQMSLTGTAAIVNRELIDAIPPDREKELFQISLGAGADASLDRGNIRSQSDPFSYSVHYRVPNVANFGGPGAVSAAFGVGSFNASSLAFLGLMPSSRQLPYACPSGLVSEDDILEFPSSIQITSLPAPVSIAADGMRFDMHYQTKDPHTVVGTIAMRTDHPRAFCTPEYYAGVRADLGKIAAALHGQILYK
jgi:transglutaminase-like putative cysteine protease